MPRSLLLTFFGYNNVGRKDYDNQDVRKLSLMRNNTVAIQNNQNVKVRTKFYSAP